MIDLEVLKNYGIKIIRHSTIGFTEKPEFQRECIKYTYCGRTFSLTTSPPSLVFEIAIEFDPLLEEEIFYIDKKSMGITRALTNSIPEYKKFAIGKLRRIINQPERLL